MKRLRSALRTLTQNNELTKARSQWNQMQLTSRSGTYANHSTKQTLELPKERASLNMSEFPVHKKRTNWTLKKI